MSHLLGLIGIGIVSLLTIIVTFYCPKITRLLITALFLRVTLLLLGNYGIELPDSSGDARSFQGLAWNIASDGFVNAINQFPGFDANSMSWIIGLIYSLTGRSLIMAQSISLFFGMGSIFLGFLIVRRIWDERSAIKVGWFFALYPSLILYSCLTLREAYVWFFLLVAIYGIVIWAENKSLKSIIISMTGFMGAAFFHGPMILGALTFVMIIFFEKLKLSLKLIKNFKIDLYAIIVILIIIFLIIFFIGKNINIPKIGTFKDAIDFEYILEIIKFRSVGDAAYPNWLIPNSIVELIYKTPIRIIYFMFSPFPWEINKIIHLAGMLDGIMFFVIVFLVFRNLKVISRSPALKVISLVILTYILIFGLSTGNFGTAIRHRTKFLISIILLIAPWIPQLNFTKKIKK